MIVDIVDKYCTDDNNPIKNLRLKSPYWTYAYIKTSPTNQSTKIVQKDTACQHVYLSIQFL